MTINTGSLSPISVLKEGSFRKVGETSPGAPPAMAETTSRDAILLSPLAQSLSGDAGALFASFGDGLREKLVNLVQSGALSTDDVVSGLSGFAKAAQASAGGAKATGAGDEGAQSRRDDYAQRRLQNASEMLALQFARQRPGADQASLDEREAALSQEHQQLRGEWEARKQASFQSAQRMLADPGLRVRLGDGPDAIGWAEASAMSRLQDVGVADEIMRASRSS